MTFARNVDLNSNVNRFNKVLLDSYDKYCPLIQKHVKNEHRVPWINEDVCFAMGLRDKMKSTRKTVQYKLWRNHCVKFIHSNKTKYFHTIIQKANGNPKKLWSYNNGFCKSKNNMLPKALVTANGTTRTKVEMAELLNKHFVQISSKLLQEYIHKKKSI